MTPGELSEQLEIKAHEFSVQTEFLTEILSRKPAVWNELRRGLNSDTATERAWNATEDGLKEMRYRLKLKSLEKEMSAIKTRLRVMSDEARNIY